MIVRYLKLKSNKKTFYDISQYVTSISWSGSTSEVARKMDITVVNAPNDPNIKGITLSLGSMLYLYEDDGTTELYRGYIIEREKSGSTGAVTYSSYDLLYYMLKSNATYNLKKKKPEEVAKLVCSDMEIPVGTLYETGHKYNLLMSDKSIYEIIMGAYTKDHSRTKNKYRMYTKKGKLSVGEMGGDVFDTVFTDDTNLTSTSYKESLADMVNRVKIYNDKGKVLKVVKNASNIQKYGIFQHTYTKEADKDPTNSAKAMLNGVTKTVEVSGLGYTGVTTGIAIIIKDTVTGLKGKFYVDSDTHTWQNGVHTMQLTLTFKQIMDTVEESS